MKRVTQGRSQEFLQGEGGGSKTYHLLFTMTKAVRSGGVPVPNISVYFLSRFVKLEICPRLLDIPLSDVNVP